MDGNDSAKLHEHDMQLQRKLGSVMLLFLDRYPRCPPVQVSRPIPTHSFANLSFKPIFENDLVKRVLVTAMDGRVYANSE